MATSGSTRDVKMTLSVETLGAEDIKKLQGDVANLAKQGGDAAPEFQRLADEIGRLGQQAEALRAFQQLAAETGTLAEQQEKAAISAGQMGGELRRLEAVTQGAVEQQRATAVALKAAQEAARANRDELALLSATTDRAGKSEDEYAAKVEKLKVAKIEQRAAIEQLQTALRAANDGVRAAVAEESKLARAYEQATGAANASNQALQANIAGVAKAADVAAQLGIATDSVAAAQAELVQGLNQAGRAAESLEVNVAKLAARQKELDDIRAFEKQADAARRLVVASEYANLFDEALRRLADTEKKAVDQKLDDKWQRDAFAMVEVAESTKRLTHEAELLVAVERELVAQAAFEKQAEDARQLVQAGAYVQMWRDELEKAERQALETAEAGKKIKDAFNTLGVRGVQELEAEIVKVRAAMETVRNTAGTTGTSVTGAFAAGEAKVAALEREIRQVSGTLTTADKAAKLFSNSLGQIAAGNVIADGVGYLVNKVKELGRAFLEAVVQGDQMRRGLNAIYGDAAVTARQIDFLRKSSSESGVAFGTLTGEFVKFSAAMKFANIPLEQSNGLFKAVTAASASLGLGAEATAGALNALGQMASKGTVSMEELRQQLGDRLPGALGLSAKGLGITESQLIKLVETGQLATRDFVVPLTGALNQLRGETEGLVPTYERFKGLLSETAQGAGEAGGIIILTGALKVLGGVVGAVALGLSTLVEGLFLAGSGVTALAARLTGDTKAWEFFGEQVERSTARVASQAAAFNNFLDPAAAATAAVQGHADALTVNTAEVVRSINANTSLDAAQKLTALSAALLADKTLDASAKFVQYNVAAAGMLKQQEALTEGYSKTAKAAKQQGDTITELARLTGDANAIANAAVVAAELQAAALEKVAASQAQETLVLELQREQMEKSRIERNLTVEEMKVQTDTLDKLLAKSRAETEQAKQASAAARAALFERQLAIDKLKDHSREIDAFKRSMESAAQTLREYERLALNGKKTDDEVAAARLALVRATALYKDSLKDAIAAVELESKAKAANLQLTITQTGAAQKHAEVMAQQARAIGDTTTATYYEIQAKEAAIKTIKLEIELRALEAEAALKMIELKRQEIPLDDALREQKLKVLDVEAKIIAIKLAGNDAAKETIRGIESEISALRQGSTEWSKQSAAIGGNTSARGANSEAMQKQADTLLQLSMKHKLSADYTEAEIALLDRLTAANEKATAAENKRLNRDAQGFSIDPTTGQRVNMRIDSQRSVYEDAKSQGLSEADALKIARQFITQNGERTGSPDRTSQLKGENWGTAVQKAINEQVLANADDAVARQTSPQNMQPASADSGQRPGTVSTVNINLGGRTTPVNVASQEDARALTSVLRQLETAKGTST